MDGWAGTPEGAGAAAPDSNLSHEQPQPRIIWHTGFCWLYAALQRRRPSGCKSVAFEQEYWSRSGCLSCRPVLHAICRRSSQLAFHLLSADFVTGERVTLEAAPAANTFCDAAMQTSGPMLFLYSDCRSFSCRFCKMGEAAEYVRNLFLRAPRRSPPGQWPARNSCPCPISNSPRWSGKHADRRVHCENWPLLGVGRAGVLDCDAFLRIASRYAYASSDRISFHLAWAKNIWNRER